MSNSTKALIFSALVFPGLGQLFLKRYKSAVFFIATALIALIVIMIDVMTKASVIANKIVAGEMSAEYSVIRKAILEQQAYSDSSYITLLIYLLIAVWLACIIDIIRLRKVE